MSAEDVFNDLHSTIDVEPKDIEKEMMATIKHELALTSRRQWCGGQQSMRGALK